jgi:hypothetical protein
VVKIHAAEFPEHLPGSETDELLSFYPGADTQRHRDAEKPGGDA